MTSLGDEARQRSATARREQIERDRQEQQERLSGEVAFNQFEQTITRLAAEFAAAKPPTRQPSPGFMQRGKQIDWDVPIPVPGLMFFKVRVRRNGAWTYMNGHTPVKRDGVSYGGSYDVKLTRLVDLHAVLPSEEVIREAFLRKLTELLNTA